MTDLKAKVFKVLETLDTLNQEPESYTAGFQEFRPRHFAYGAYVECVIVVQENGSVLCYSDNPAEGFDERGNFQSYPSLEAWAWQMATYCADYMG